MKIIHIRICYRKIYENFFYCFAGFIFFKLYPNDFATTTSKVSTVKVVITIWVIFFEGQATSFLSGSPLLPRPHLRIIPLVANWWVFARHVCFQRRNSVRQALIKTSGIIHEWHKKTSILKSFFHIVQWTDIFLNFLCHSNKRIWP